MVTKPRPLRGKGANKRNKNRKPQSEYKLREQYAAMHLNRRATYRSLTALARIMAAVSPRAVSGLIELRGDDVVVPRRKFTTVCYSDKVTCSFPVALVNTPRPDWPREAR